MVVGNILVSSVFYDRTRAPLKDIGNLQAGSNIGGAVISRPEVLTHPQPSHSTILPPTTPIPTTLPDSAAHLPASILSWNLRLRTSHYTFLPSFVRASVLTRLCSHIPGKDTRERAQISIDVPHHYMPLAIFLWNKVRRLPPWELSILNEFAEFNKGLKGLLD